MKENQKNKSVFDNLSFIREGLIELKQETAEDTNKKIDSYVDKIDSLTTFFKGFNKLFLILTSFIILLLIILIISQFYAPKVIKFNNEINDLKNDSLVRKILEIKEIKKNDSVTTTTYNYLVRDEQVVTYNMLSKENDSLNQQLETKNKAINNIENKVSNLQTKLNLVTKYYNIKFKESKRQISFESKQLDSAMILLDYYRDKMKYDPATDKWNIKH